MLNFSQFAPLFLIESNLFGDKLELIHSTSTYVVKYISWADTVVPAMANIAKCDYDNLTYFSISLTTLSKSSGYSCLGLKSYVLQMQTFAKIC